jgi:basic amino acid/polyamine antiporter, APA family
VRFFVIFWRQVEAMVAELLAAAARRRPAMVVTPAAATPSSSSLNAAAADDCAEADDKPLGLLDLVGIGVGGTLGSGLFLLAGRAARDVAGPAVTVSFALAALACLFSGMAYAEMSSRDPDCGGAYAFAYTALGELPAFLVGCCLTLEYGVASAAIARSWASYLGEAFLSLPSWTVGRDSFLSVFAFALVLAITAVLSAGMREAKWIINGSTTVYAVVVIVIIAVGSNHVDTDNWTPFMPYGVTGVLTGASHVFFSFIGFDEVATVAEEARNAAQNVPTAMILSLAIVAVIYVGATLVLTGMVNYADIDLEAPFSAAFRAVNMHTVAKLVGLGTATGMMNTTLVSLAAQPRIFVSMGRDGLLPRYIASTTRATTIRCGIVVSLFALAAPTELLADVVSGGTLLAFLATNLALMNSRIRLHSESGVRHVFQLAGGCLAAGTFYRLATLGLIPTPVVCVIAALCIFIPSFALFRTNMLGGALYEESPPVFLCPLVPLFPIAGVATTAFLLTQLPGLALAGMLGWLTIAFCIYVLYGMHNSVADSHSLLSNQSLSTYDGVDGAPPNLSGETM